MHAASPWTLCTAGPSLAALELGDVLMPPLDPDQRRERGGPGLTLRSPTAEACLQRLGCQVRTKCLLLCPGGQTAGEAGEDAQLPMMDGPSGRWSCTLQESPVQQRGAAGAPVEVSAHLVGPVPGGRVGRCPGAGVRGRLWGGRVGRCPGAGVRGCVWGQSGALSRSWGGGLCLGAEWGTVQELG